MASFRRGGQLTPPGGCPYPSPRRLIGVSMGTVAILPPQREHKHVETRCPASGRSDWRRENWTPFGGEPCRIRWVAPEYRADWIAEHIYLSRDQTHDLDRRQPRPRYTSHQVQPRIMSITEHRRTSNPLAQRIITYFLSFKKSAQNFSEVIFIGRYLHIAANRHLLKQRLALSLIAYALVHSETTIATCIPMTTRTLLANMFNALAFIVNFETRFLFS